MKKKFIKRIYHLILAFIAGMITLCILQSVISVASDRVGARGGEFLVIPLFVILIAVGFDIGRAYFKDIEAKKIAQRGFAEGYKTGTIKTISEFLLEAKSK